MEEEEEEEEEESSLIIDLKRYARLAVAWSRHGSLVPRWLGPDPLWLGQDPYSLSSAVSWSDPLRRRGGGTLMGRAPPLAEPWGS